MSIDTLAHSYRVRLKAHGAEAAQDLTDAHAQAVQAIMPRLDRLYREVTTMQAQAETDEHITPTFLQGRALAGLKQVVIAQINAFAEFAKMTVRQLLHFAASLGAQAAREFFVQVLPGQAVTTLPVPDLVQEHRLAELFGSFGMQAAQGVGDALRRGLALGSSVTVMAGEVKKALDVSRHRALTIADTELFKAFNQVVRATCDANSSQVTGWVWHCQLAPHSCAACVALHGTVHPLSEVLHDHPNGSCMALPYVEGMALPQSGLDWFARQDEEVQRSIFGTKTAYKLYQSGTPLAHFVCMRHDGTHGTSVYQCSAKDIWKG